MKISHSIVVLPPAPSLDSLVPGQAFSFTHGPTTGRTYMLVQPWDTLAEELGTKGLFVDLDTGILYNTGDIARTVNVLHSEVLVA